MARTFGDINGSSGDTTVRQAVKYFVWGIIGLIALIAILSIPFTIQAGERGVITTFGKPSARIAEEGLNVKMPFIQHVYKFNVRTQTSSFDNKAGTGDTSEYSSLFSSSKDLLEVQTAVVVNWHIQPETVMNIYRTYGIQGYYDMNIIEPMIRETVKATTAKYTVEELVQKRDQVSADIENSLREKMATKSAVLERVNIVNFEPPKEYKDSITRKSVAEQDALAARNKLEQVKYEAEQKVAEAEGKAKAMTVEAEALRQNQQILQLRAIEKWDGKLSLVSSTGGNAITPIVDVSSLINANTTG